MYFVYILEGINNKKERSLYVGYTTDLKKRIEKHKTRSSKTTKFLKLIKLIYYEACLNKNDAHNREIALKTGFGREYIKRRLKNYFAGPRSSAG